MKKIVKATIAFSLIAFTTVAMANTGVSCKNNRNVDRNASTAFKIEKSAKAKTASVKGKEKTATGYR